MAYLVKISNRLSGGQAFSEHRTVATSRMTIGRGADCSIYLNDTKKQVSRLHAAIDVKHPGHSVSNVSRINPIILNGVMVGPGEIRPISQGDVIEIGDFAMEVLEVFEPSPQSSSIPPAAAAAPFDFGLNQSAVPGEDPFKELENMVAPKSRVLPKSSDGQDPFFKTANLSAGLVDGVGKSSNLHQPGPASFDSSYPLCKFPTPSPPSSGASSLDHILGQPSTGSGGRPLVDLDKHNSGGSSNIDHVQPDKLPFKPPPVSGEPRSATAPATAPPQHDPFDGFDPLGSLVAPMAKAAPASGEKPSIGDTQRWPRDNPIDKSETLPLDAIQSPGLVSSPAQPGVSLASPHAARGLSAFLEGAGLSHLKISDDDAEEFLRESGAIVRAAVEGLVGLLLARSEMKKEMRAEDRTMIANRDNNPLKLMTNPQEAISFLFDREGRLPGAFLPPVQAVLDACDDMRVHEIAMMAGMRAAFQGALKRFAPETLEREFDRQKGSFNLNKKVKLWDAFVSYHNKISAESEDDLLKVFGKEFTGTYMAQVRRLRAK